ncbi:thioredoxin [Limibacter armeniacum]|uniref:thioredoxin n=1 Tax=Limibacter armeniacum TaxID=466084 RepID=UPI002FE53D01
MSKFNKLISTSKVPVLVDFYADWCQPCHALAPIIREVAREYGEELKVIKVNIDKNRQAAAKYQVRSIPTLLLFNKGKIAWRGSGVMPAPKLKEILSQYV